MTRTIATMVTMHLPPGRTSIGIVLQRTLRNGEGRAGNNGVEGVRPARERLARIAVAKDMFCVGEGGGPADGAAVALAIVCFGVGRNGGNGMPEVAVDDV